MGSSSAVREAEIAALIAEAGAVQEADLARRTDDRRLKRMRRRSNTILTSSAGLVDAEEPKTLLGESVEI